MVKQAFPFSIPLESSVILQKRSKILTAIMAMDKGFSVIPVRSMAHETLGAMLHLYDQQFFSGFFEKKLPDLQISLSARLTSAAGKFVYKRGLFGKAYACEIRMSSDFLTRLAEGPFHLNGLEAVTPQEAFLIVFEHELCHAAETALYGKTGHSDRFKSLAKGLFGHTSARHSLPTRRQEAAQEGLLVGSNASFDYQGQRMTGVITYIGKTATVMVSSRSGAYCDKHGRRYDKYRVSPRHLILISDQITQQDRNCGIMEWVMKDGKIIRNIPEAAAGNRGGAKEEPKQECGA